MAKKNTGTNYERVQARRLGAKRIGGPGNPDLVKGRMKAEVKDWKKPVGASVIEKAKSDGNNRVISKNGFTDVALERAKQLGIRTEHPRSDSHRKK